MVLDEVYDNAVPVWLECNLEKSTKITKNKRNYKNEQKSAPFLRMLTIIVFCAPLPLGKLVN